MGMSSSVIGGGLSLLGGVLGGQSAQNAASTSTQGQIEAARIAADAAKFRPVGITTRYGSSNFQFDPTTGYLTGANYMATPELQAMQSRVDALNNANLGYAEQSPSLYSPLLGGAQTMFNQAGLGLKASPEQQAADWLQKQQALLAPGRERESALLANQLSNSGRTGISIAQGGGLLSANPEQSALANARALQDLTLASQATQEGRNATNFYGGLFSNAGNLTSQYGQGLTGGYAPFSAGFNVGQSLESAAQTPLTLGAGLGGQAAAYGANAGRFITQGAQAAAPYAYQANAFNPYANALIGAGTNPSLSSGIANWWNTTPQWTPQQFQQQQAATYGSANAGFGSAGGFFD